MAITRNQGGISVVGYNAASNTGEDIWDGSAAYTFPAAAAATTIVSDSANDTGAGDGGTGARTVLVEGLDASRNYLSQIVSLNGVAAVTLASQYLRINHVRVLTAGSGAANAGVIQVKHAATVLAQIPAAANITQMAIYTLPAGSPGYLVAWRVSASDDAILALQVREPGGLWYTIETIVLLAAGTSVVAIPQAIRPRIAPGSDFRVRAVLGGAAVKISAGFELSVSRG
jgi:hypothetical protein